MSLNLGTLTIRIAGDTTGLVQLENRVRQFGLRMRIVGSAINQSFGAPITLGVGAAVREFASFDDAIAQSLSVMRGVTPEMRGLLEQQAEALAQRLAPSAVEVARSYEYLALAGLDAKSALAAAQTTIQFATAGHFDAKRAVDLLTDSQSALGLTVRNNARENARNMLYTSDLIVKGATIANTSVEELALAIQNRAGAEMRLLGRDAAEMVAALAVMADQGTKGKRAGEGLAITLRDLQRRATDNEDAFRALGIEVFNPVTGNMRSMWEIVTDLDDAFGNLSDKERILAFNTLDLSDKNLRALKVFLDMGTIMRDWTDILKDVGGTTEDIANNQMQSFSKQIGNLWEVFKAGARVMGEDFAPVVQNIASIFAGLSGKYKELSKESRQFFVNTALILVTLGPVLTTVGLLSIALSGLVLPVIAVKKAFAGFAKVLALSLTRTGLMAVVIGGLVALMIAYSDEMSEATSQSQSFADDSWGAMKALGQNVSNLFLDSLPESVREKFHGVNEAIASAFAKTYANANEQTRESMRSVAEFLAPVKKASEESGNAAKDTESAWTRLMGKVSESIEFMKTAAKGLADPSEALRKMAEDIGVAYTPLVDILEDLDAAIKKIVQGSEEPEVFIQGVAKRLDITLDHLKQLKSSLGDTMKDFTKDLLKGEASFMGFLERIGDAIFDFLFSGVFSALGNAFGSAIGGAFGISTTPAPASGAKALGGSVNAGRSYLVGERGAELLTLGSQGGHVTPASEFGRATGTGFSFNQVINVMHDKGTEVEISSQGDGISEITNIFIRSAAGDVLRNGPLGKAIGQRFGRSAQGGRR